DVAGTSGDLLNQQDGGDGGTDLDHEHDRVSSHRARVQFSQRLTNRGLDERTLEKATGARLAGSGELLAFVGFGSAGRRRDEPAGRIRVALRDGAGRAA